MSLQDYTTLQSEHVEMLASTLSKRDMPFLHKIEPIADFEELYTFVQEHPTPIVFNQNHPPWYTVSVAARIIEGIAISIHEDLDLTDWKKLAQILLEHTEYLFTFNEAASQNEELSAGIALALMGCICDSIQQSELWRITGFGRITIALGKEALSTADTQTIHLLNAAFSQANALEHPIIKTAIDHYNSVLMKNPATEKKKKILLPNADTESTKASRDELSVPNHLLHLLVNPSPAVSATTEIGLAALHSQNLRINEQIFMMVSRRYKWIVDSFFYPDGFHIDKSLISQFEAISDFSKFFRSYETKSYETGNHNYQLACLQEMQTVLKNLMNACIYLRQPDMSYPPIGTNPLYNMTELNKNSNIDLNESGHKELPDAMPYTGYYVMRGGSEHYTQYLLFDGGPAGKMGSNAKLSFSLFANGHQLITHKTQNSNNTNKGTDNIIILNDAKRQPSEPEIVPDPDTRWITTDAFDFVESWYKASNYQHKRSIFYKKNEYFILHDLILGNVENLIQQIFHFDPNVLQENNPLMMPTKCQVLTQSSGQSNIFISSVDQANVSVQLNGSQVTYQKQCELPASMNIVLFPFATGDDQHPFIKTLSVETDADVLASGFTVISDYGTDVFLISDDGYANMETVVKETTVVFIGEYLFLRGEHFMMLNGRYLKVGTNVLLDLDEPCEYYNSEN